MPPSSPRTLPPSARYTPALRVTSASPVLARRFSAFSNWSEEDQYAVIVYLRHLPAVRHATPEPVPGNAITIPGAIEQDYAGKDYGIK